MSTGETRGAALLEAMVAVAILATSGLSVLGLLSAAARHQAMLAERESTLRQGDLTLAALSLYGRADLDRRLGRHPAGRFVADVRRPEPSLYRIALLDSDTSRLELLVTVVHRPAPAEGP